jgi:hypothetical protein
MPKLTTFHVSSPWNEVLKWSKEVTAGGKPRHPLDHPSLTHLQVPDSLHSVQDIAFMSELPKRFPNLVSCRINLPSVAVVRAFAAAMENLASFKELNLKVQYDFASTLDTIFLTNPSTTLSFKEKEEIRVLKAYPFWKEYVDENKIEVPNETKLNHVGLEVLKYNNIKTFVIKHIPRVLRIPAGDIHFNEDIGRDFSQTLIGFRDNPGFPFTKEAWNAAPKCKESIGFDVSIEIL